MDHSVETVDFAIVTALESERTAVVSRLESLRVISEQNDPYTFYRGTITTGPSDQYEVVVVQLIEIGNVEAAATAAQAIRRWNPRFVLMVGIAGGIAKNGVGVGDVVVASYVHYYEPGKRTDAGEQRRPRVFNGDRVLYGKARHYEAAEWKDSIDVAPPGEPSGFIPKAHFGPIASGELVIADSQTVSLLLQEAPKLVGLAMEGAGVALAAMDGGCKFLEIRGISDLADANKADNWQAYAANAAAAFTVGFLKSGPVSSMKSGEVNRKTDGRSPLLVVRAQGHRKIRPNELFDVLGEELKSREVQTAVLDFTDEVSPTGVLSHPEAAVNRLLSPDGELLRILGLRDQVEFVFHGHVHIPIAVLAGFLFTDRLPVRFYDFHPTTVPASWNWPAKESDAFPDLKVTLAASKRMKNCADAAMRVSISYDVDTAAVRSVVPTPCAEVDVRLDVPFRGIVSSERQVLGYGRIFRQALDSLAARMPNRRGRIHLFYAGPVSLAFHIGQLISPSIHPPVLVWNYARGYEWAIDLGAAARSETAIEWARKER
jgi:nucleoside phosphorylase